MQNKTMITQNKRLIGILLAAASLLLVPAVAMLFTGDVAWDLADFVIAGVLLFGTGLLFELASRMGESTAYRVAGGLALATALFLVWANLAVGIIGNEENPANVMYYGVLAVGLIGAGLARLQPRGMTRALFATAFAQMLVGVIALVAGLGSAFTVVINGFFALLWIAAGLLFRRAGKRRPAPGASSLC